MSKALRKAVMLALKSAAVEKDYTSPPDNLSLSLAGQFKLEKGMSFENGKYGWYLPLKSNGGTIYINVIEVTKDDNGRPHAYEPDNSSYIVIKSVASYQNLGAEDQTSETLFFCTTSLFRMLEEHGGKIEL